MSRIIKEMFIISLGVGSVIYLMAPSLLPDVLPVVGALDEVTATIILTNVLAYYGINLGDFMRPGAQRQRQIEAQSPPDQHP